ncbi:MAG: DNA-binding response regulator [Gaiellales bacterium]|nr:MAG: DNA-binding response regulator [Gaiellales bacterium]
MPNETVLVIDSDAEYLHRLKEGISQAGYRVLTSVDGANMKQVARDERPDAIILDFDLAGNNALEICRQIKGDNVVKHTPVIFTHNKPKKEQVVAALEVGGHDIIPRKLGDEEFLARLAAAVRLKQGIDRLRLQNSKLEALAKHVRAAVQHFEQPRAMEGAGVELEDTDITGEAIVRLTRRETEILQLLARGLSNEVISNQLYISPTTTRNHIQNILGKLGVHSKLEAVAYAVRAGYVDFVG